MESSLKELAGYRLARAKEMLSASESNLEIGQYKTFRIQGRSWWGRTSGKGMIIWQEHWA